MDDPKYDFTTNFWYRLANNELLIKTLAPFVGKPNVRYLEVGVFEGQSLIWMLENVLTHPSAQATAVDLFKRGRKRFQHNLKSSRQSQMVKIYEGRSHETLKTLPSNYFDFIYIDAGHDLKSVIRDAVYCWDLLKEEGIMIFDDYKMFSDTFPIESRPEKAIDFFLAAFRSEAQVLFKNYEVIVQKKPDVTIGKDISRFGCYVVNWYLKQVVSPEGYIPFTEQDWKSLKCILDSVVFNDGVSTIWQSQETLDFLRKYDLKKEDFFHTGIWNSKEAT